MASTKENRDILVVEAGNDRSSIPGSIILLTSPGGVVRAVTEEIAKIAEDERGARSPECISMFASGKGSHSSGKSITGYRTSR